MDYCLARVYTEDGNIKIVYNTISIELQKLLEPLIEDLTEYHLGYNQKDVLLPFPLKAVLPPDLSLSCHKDLL